MPKLWKESIEQHRGAVREATLDATAALVPERGLHAVTMSEVARATGIGRATLYKYFRDVEALLGAWHERQVHRHLLELRAIRDQGGNTAQRLEAVLHAYALIAQRRHGGDPTGLLHQEPRVDDAGVELHPLQRDLLSEGAADGSCGSMSEPANSRTSACTYSAPPAA